MALDPTPNRNTSILKMNHYQKTQALSQNWSWEIVFWKYTEILSARLLTSHRLPFYKQSFFILRNKGITEDTKVNNINKFRHYPAVNGNLLKQSKLLNVWSLVFSF